MLGATVKRIKIYRQDIGLLRHHRNSCYTRAHHSATFRAIDMATRPNNIGSRADYRMRHIHICHQPGDSCAHQLKVLSSITPQNI